MLYKFHCNNCDKNIELSLKVADLPNAVCSECGSENIVRQYSPISQQWNCEGSYSSGRK